MDHNSKQYLYIHSSCVFTSDSPFNIGSHVWQCQHKKRHSPNKCTRSKEAVKSDCDSRPSRMEAGPGDVVCKENGFPSPAEEGLNVVHQYHEGVSERGKSFRNEISDNLL